MESLLRSLIDISLQDIRNPRLIDCNQFVCLVMTYELVRAHPRHSMPNGLTLVASVNRQRKSCVKRTKRIELIVRFFCFLFQYFLNSSFELETMIFHFKIDRKRSLYFREKGFRTGLSDVPIEFPRTAQRFYTECTQDLFSFFFLYKISFGQKSKIVKFWFVDSS